MARLFPTGGPACLWRCADACDFVGGDFYGGAAQFSLVCKTFYSLSPTRPFEFMTSRTWDLTDFVTIKPVEELRIESAIPTIHSAALLFIDAINPDGTINHDVYRVLKMMNDGRAVYEPFLGGKLLGDVAIYYDKESMYDPSQNGTPVEQLRGRSDVSKITHLEGVIGAARILREAHIPFGVITNVTLDQLEHYRALIIPSVLEMTPEQATISGVSSKAAGCFILVVQAHWIGLPSRSRVTCWRTSSQSAIEERWATRSPTSP